MKIRFLLSIAGLIFLTLKSYAQPYTLQVSINSQSDSVVAIGSVQGDRFIFCDSLATRTIRSGNIPLKLITWTFPPDAKPGMYRIILGYTTYAKVMDEAPQQLDFIYNKEDIRMQTDFNAPADSLDVIASEENRSWFSFREKEQDFRKKLEELEMEVNYYQKKMSGSAADAQNQGLVSYEAKAASVANSFNILQMERESFISRAAAEHSHLFAGRIIRTFRAPFRDGYLSEAERKVSWQKEYFRFIDFSDEAVMHTPVLTDKIFNYLVTYNRPEFSKSQREDAYIEAVGALMNTIEKSAGKGAAVYTFVLDYLVDGFQRLGMNKVLSWISDNYGSSFCTSGEKTTSLRKLEALKMVAGTAVPDFTLKDMNGRPVTFSKVSKKRNLIVFWASWCPHCKNLLPEIKTICDGKSDLEVFAVSLDRSENDWQNAVSAAGIEHFQNLSDLLEWDSPTAADYNVFATPVMFLVDSARKIIACPSTAEELSVILAGY